MFGFCEKIWQKGVAKAGSYDIIGAFLSRRGVDELV